MNKKEEQQKPVVVKQFIANWYEENKHSLEFNIWVYVYMFDRQENTSFKEWFNDPKTEPFKTLVNMHQFGYEVEKEKKYIVKLNGVSSSTNVLKHNISDDTWYMGIEEEFYALTPCHTKKQLENAGFGWVFSCKGMEVTEVEEG